MGISHCTQAYVGGFAKDAWRTHKPALSVRKAAFKPLPDKWLKSPGEFHSAVDGEVHEVLGECRARYVGYLATCYSWSMRENSMLLVSTFTKLSRCLANVFLRTKTKTVICWFGNKTLATLVGVLNAFLPAPWGEAPQPWEHAVVLQPERMPRCWPQTWCLPVVWSNPALPHAVSKDQWLW